MKAESLSSTNRTWPGLDGLRGLAVLAVVAYHTQILASGYIGVDVFFVLSGFLITRLLLKEMERTGRIRLGSFYARRALRLYPALVVMVVVTVGLSTAASSVSASTLRDALAALTYTSNLVQVDGILDHTWTLSLEEQFYLVWPLIIGFVLSGSTRLRFVLPVAVLTVLLVADSISGQSTVLHTYVRAMGLPVGCALALLPERGVARLAPFAIPAGFGLALIAGVAIPTAFTTGWPVSVAAVLTVPLVARVVSSRSRFLECGALRYFGVRSYSLYLWHFPCISVIVHHGPQRLGPVVLMALALIASFTAAELSYRFVERPVLRWRDHRSARLDRDVAQR